MSESTELAVIDVLPNEMAIRRPPEEVLAEATRAAKCLKTVLDGKAKKVVFNGERYLENEDWQTIGRFYNLTARVTDCKYVEAGEAWGYQARAVVLTSEYREVSEAFASCFSDEPNWSRKPRFQLESMAQTRACSKALRNVLAFVPVLAGYRPTPAEELDGMAQRVEQSSSPRQNRPTPVSTPETAQNASPVTTDGQNGQGKKPLTPEEAAYRSGARWLRAWMDECHLPSDAKTRNGIATEALACFDTPVEDLKSLTETEWTKVKAHCQFMTDEDILAWQAVAKNAVGAGK